MDFNLSEEHLMIRDAARDFARTELLPGVIERDTHQQFPTEQVKKMGELGFLGMMVDPKYGGGGMDTMTYVLAMEELTAEACEPIAQTIVEQEMLLKASVSIVLGSTRIWPKTQPYVENSRSISRSETLTLFQVAP